MTDSTDTPSMNIDSKHEQRMISRKKVKRVAKITHCYAINLMMLKGCL